MKPAKANKFKEITDEMIGKADRVCSCASTVGDIIVSKNKGKNAPSLKKIIDSLKKK